jgi:hypothetical protein
VQCEGEAMVGLTALTWESRKYEAGRREETGEHSSHWTCVRRQLDLGIQFSLWTRHIQDSHLRWLVSWMGEVRQGY